MAFLFEFEANSEERHLCIPMEVRLKLDLCGVKTASFSVARIESIRTRFFG
jgi:hypothetical protein